MEIIPELVAQSQADLARLGIELGRPEDRRSFIAVVEAFLAAHIGGRCEWVGDDFEASTIEFKTGRELIPGLD
jgi:hypothetical protein